MRTHVKVAMGLFVVGLVYALVPSVHAAMIDETKLFLSDPNPTGGDLFGASVAINGGVAVVGASGNNTPVAGCGSAYVFNVATGAETYKLSAVPVVGGGSFGTSVGVSGNVAVIGAPGGPSGGSAYLHDVTTGAYLRTLTGSDTAAADSFGRSAGIDGGDGGVAIVGAYGNDGAASGAGAAYLFNVADGSQRHRLVADDAAAAACFGYSVAVSGDVALVGAYRDAEAGSSAGAAYLFNATTGDQMHKLMALDTLSSDFFGCSVAISGDVAIVGAYRNDGAGADAGAAYLFDVTTGFELHKLTADDAAVSDYFGWSVAISGGVALVGAYYDDDAGTSSGSAYLFDVATGAQIMKMTPSDAAAGDNFGYSVAVSGDRGIGGARLDDDVGTDTGLAYLFEATPEPATLTLLALGGLGVLARRKRKD